MRATLLWIIAAISTFGASALAAQGFPAEVTGIWAEPNCDSATHARIINRLGIIDFVQVGSPSVQMSAFQTIDYDQGTGTLKATVVVPSIDRPLPLEINLSGSRLDDNFVRCDRPPAELRWGFGEALGLFDALGKTAEQCATAWTALCMMPVLEFVDITGDRKLSIAEISRLFRASAFFVGYALLHQNLVPLRQLGGFAAVAGVLSPIVVKGIVSGMDYDQDGLLSTDELLQDRGDFAGFAALGLAFEPLAAQTAMTAVVNALPTMLAMLFSLLH